MTLSRRQFFKLSGAAVVATSLQAEWGTPPSQALAADNPLLHLLNRISWGARPEELARATVLGFDAYLDEQLNPATIDNHAVEKRLRHLPILDMDRYTIHRLRDAEYRGYVSLVKGFLIRATHSRRQLLERMVEFWADHFNISGEDYVVENVIFQREVIRTHALGNFRDLLFASAKSPAMLYYLDNFINVAEHPNENYARELLELHTLGVDGGYTEEDVYEVARAFTGWTVRNVTDRGFFFSHEEHDTNAKQVLGHSLPTGRGIEDGLHVLSIVANHPATAQFLSRKLCVRFVSDTPPQNLVDSTARVWRETAGDIKSVLRHLFTSAEFAQSAGQKFRRPLDFYIGALRATGTEIHDDWITEELLRTLGQMPYGWHPPDGYPDTAAAWVSTSGLLARWNTAMLLTHDAYSNRDLGATTQLRQRIGQPATVGQLVDQVAEQVFGVPLPTDLAAPFIAYAADDGSASTPVDHHRLARKLGTLYGLMLASPLYQWR